VPDLVIRDNVLEGDANGVYEEEDSYGVKTYYKIIDVSSAMTWGMATGTTTRQW
jgi:hypothetical protein